jgi:hypothetical protein
MINGCLAPCTTRDPFKALWGSHSLFAISELASCKQIILIGDWIMQWEIERHLHNYSIRFEIKYIARILQNPFFGGFFSKEKEKVCIAVIDLGKA